MIPHGIEDVAPLDRARARRRLGLDDRFTVLCFGFVAPYKGIELVLDAARHAGPGVHVVVAGGEHPRMGGEQRLRRRAARRLTATSRRSPDGSPTTTSRRWFTAADVAVFPYPKPFSSSGALALALAHGTPVLLSPPLARCAGAPSVMTVPIDARSLARRLDELAASPAALDELRRGPPCSPPAGAGRRSPAATPTLYEEVIADAERAARRRLRAG